MPRISDQILNCSIYLYSSKKAAERGEKAGGSGFLVGVKSEVASDKYYMYAVTNSHVIREGGSPVVRLNTTAGGIDILDAAPDHWNHHPDGDDVAVCTIGGITSHRHQVKCIPTDMFVSQDIIDRFNIGSGDDAYLVGRFVNHEGRQRNTPSLRFGNIAMMPGEGIYHKTRGIEQESFLVEIKSIGGYSGSPVFVHIPPFAKRPTEWPPEGLPRFGNVTPVSFGPWLLGVDWCHIQNEEVVRDRSGDELEEKWHVESNTGMMGVVPAWKLLDVLNLDSLLAERKRADEILARECRACVLD